MAELDLSSIECYFKQETVPGTPETGAGATGLELLSGSQGFGPNVAEIATEMINNSLMADRSRQGSEFFPWSADTELSIDNCDEILEAVVGGTWAPEDTISNTEMGAVVISGSGTIITFASGNLASEGGVPGGSLRFTGLSVVANDGKPFPIVTLSANGRVVTTEPGILADNASDVAYSLIIEKKVHTATPYLKRAFTMEHYLRDIDRSLRASYFVFNGITLTLQADKKIKVGIKGAASKLELLATAASPNFTSATFPSGESLVMLDGAILFNGVPRVNLSSFNFTLEGAVAGNPRLTTRQSAKPYLSQFKLSGQFTGEVADGADFDSFRAEDQVQVMIRMKEQSATPLTARHKTITFPNMSFGNWSLPMAGEGAAIQTVTMNGGRDKRGGVHPLTSMIVSGTS